MNATSNAGGSSDPLSGAVTPPESRMNAIVAPKYGSPDVLRYETVPTPTPATDEVLIGVHAAGVNAADWHLLRADPLLVRLSFGLRKPKHPILGADVAGRVEAVGAAVTEFEPGDAVFGDLSDSGHGGFAEYVCAEADALAPKPTNLSYVEAAASPLAGVTALQGLRDEGGIQNGDDVLITGASGGVGTFAVQLAKTDGATVTGVCSSAKVELVHSLGADHVVDYEEDDFTAREERYDLIFDAGAYRSVRAVRRLLRPDGRYVFVGGANRRLFEAMLLGPVLSALDGRSLGNFMATPNREDLLELRDRIESGDISPVIDREFPLADVPAAIQYLEEGRARGKVVISAE